MTTIIAGLEDVVLKLDSSKSGWTVRESLRGVRPQSLRFDPHNPDRAYCGATTMLPTSSSRKKDEKSGGIWVSDDGGSSWSKSKSEVGTDVTSLSVSSLERGSGDFGVVFAGTEPSLFFRSEDGGESWKRMDEMNKLESSSSWSFPPRPYTHHVRWIESDLNTPGYIFAAIEAGALVKSQDGGRTWIDRVASGPFDTHTLATHKKAPKRLYSSAGDGYFESLDYGETWRRPMSGLGHRYLYGLAVDSRDPGNVIVSASSGPFEAHFASGAESFAYRKEKGSERWEKVTKGLPDAEGTMAWILRSGDGVFYALSNKGIFSSEDAGTSWKNLGIDWKEDYLSQHAWAIDVREE